MSSRRGFTLIELLVVIGVIAVLIGILMPVINRVWQSANGAKCKENVRTLTVAFITFARDHEGQLPGSKNSFYVDRDPEHWDWLFGAYSVAEYEPNPATGANFTLNERLAFAPQNGTIWKYVSRGDSLDARSSAFAVYRCPSLAFQKAGSGVGSNGRFDYAAWSCFCGAKLSSINTVSELHYAMDPTNPNLVLDTQAPWSRYGLSTFTERRPTPLICQEDATRNINSNLEGQHSSSDQMSHIHDGGSFYGAVDGSIQWIKEPDTDPNNYGSEGTFLWWQTGQISGQPVPLTGDPGMWGAWSHQ